MSSPRCCLHSMHETLGWLNRSGLRSTIPILTLPRIRGSMVEGVTRLVRPIGVWAFSWGITYIHARSPRDDSGAASEAEGPEDMSRLLDARVTFQRLVLGCILLLIALAVALGLPAIQFAGPQVERLANGSFEDGFEVTPAGSVGAGWHWFHNAGAASYAFSKDEWEPVISAGRASQLISISTLGRGGAEPDRYAGIYQTVAVEPGETYQLSMQGMLRALEDDPDRVGCNYRVQYGVDYEGATDWRVVTEWVDVPWDTVYTRQTLGHMESYTVSLVAKTQRMTVFVRVWKKWATTEREIMANLDGISLKGAMPTDANTPGETYSVVKAGESSFTIVENTTVTDAEKLSVALKPPKLAITKSQSIVTIQGTNDVGVTMLALYDNGALVDRSTYEVGMLSVTEDFGWRPKKAGVHTLRAVARDVVNATAILEVEVYVGRNGQFLKNGSFENGFRATPAGMVGQDWGWFHNEGRVNVGFYDDVWAPVVYNGAHSQLIEISSVGQPVSDPDQYAGIFQTVGGLTTGADYTLTVCGMLRALADDEDREGFNYQVQWGIDGQGTSDWRAVENWSVIPWHQVHPRTDPGVMEELTTVFKAPSSKVTLFVRLWKKWGTIGREIGVNLDSITLTGYK